MMFPTLIRRLAADVKPKLEVVVNPYKAKKVWPPDFTKLSPQEQLRFEKRYKRRIRLMGTRPRWIKFTKIAQVVCITCTLALAFPGRTGVGLELTDIRIAVCFYFVFLMPWQGPHEPFGPVSSLTLFWGFWTDSLRRYGNMSDGRGKTCRLRPAIRMTKPPRQQRSKPAQAESYRM